jgi:phosphoglycerate dehydrogenase-like enzyme
MQVKVLALRELTGAQTDQLQAAAPGLNLVSVAPADPASIERALTPDVEVLLTGRGDFSLRQARALRWAQLEMAGVDHLHSTELWQSDLTLTSANGAHIPHTPEFVLAVMLAHAHRLPLAFEFHRQSHWAGGAQRPLLTPRELRGLTLGIVGYGAIGREIARLATAFGMRVVATHRAGNASPHYAGYQVAGTGDPTGALPAAYFPLSQLHDLLQQSDVVVLAVPLCESTRHLIGASALAHMQPEALLINIGRGGLIDHSALLAALQKNTLGGAVLDVTDPEPLPSDHPLWRMERVVITPHIAGLSSRYDDNVITIFAENLRRYVKGEPLLNVVQRGLGY